MKNEKPCVYVQCGDTKMHLDNALIGGNLIEENGIPIAFYGGNINIVEVATTLMYTLRAVMKITTAEHGMPLEKARELIIFCMQEASDREMEENNNPSAETLVKKFIDNLY
jgi:hypothetical protein